MEIIKKTNLIPLLQNSQLAEQFKDDICVPKKYILTDYKIKYELVINKNNFEKIMDQLRFFMVKELPQEIYRYVLRNKSEIDLSKFKDFFFDELTLLKKCKKYELASVCAQKGYTNLFKFACDNGCKNENALGRAAHSGNLECVKYLINDKSQCKIYAINWAAEAGQLKVLKYLYQYYTKHYSSSIWFNTTYWASKGSNLDCLKYLIENGCPYVKFQCLRVCKSKEMHNYINSLII